MFKFLSDFFRRLFSSNSIPKSIQVDKPVKLTNPILVETKESTFSVNIPFAIQYKNRMKTKGLYEQKYPLGAVVHFTAGRFEHGLQDAKDMIDYGNENGYAYLCIARTGELVQAHEVNRWGYHAGESAWKNLVGGVSDDLIGIEMCCAGKLEKTSDGKFKTWFGTYIPKEDVRFVTEEEYGAPTGWYHKYSPEQEATLIKTLQWLKRNDPFGVFNFDLVLGHHEVAGKLGIGYFRKNDPGGSLSMPMSELRKLLKKTN